MKNEDEYLKKKLLNIFDTCKDLFLTQFAISHIAAGIGIITEALQDVFDFILLPGISLLTTGIYYNGLFSNQPHFAKRMVSFI